MGDEIDFVAHIKLLNERNQKILDVHLTQTKLLLIFTVLFFFVEVILSGYIAFHPTEPFSNFREFLQLGNCTCGRRI